MTKLLDKRIADTLVCMFPASFHMQMVSTNGTSLYVRVGGKGPAVALLHGFGDTGDMWAPGGDSRHEGR